MNTPAYVPQIGDIIRINFTPQAGREQMGSRPAIVLSPDAYNGKTGLVVVCPITNQGKGYPWEVQIPPQQQVTGVVLVDHVKSLDWRKRRAQLFCPPVPGLLVDVQEKLQTFLFPDDVDEAL